MRPVSRGASHPRLTKRMRKSSTAKFESHFLRIAQRPPTTTILDNSKNYPSCCWYGRQAMWLGRMACKYLLDTDGYGNNCSACRHVSHTTFSIATTVRTTRTTTSHMTAVEQDRRLSKRCPRRHGEISALDARRTRQEFSNHTHTVNCMQSHNVYSHTLVGHAED